MNRQMALVAGVLGCVLAACPPEETTDGSTPDAGSRDRAGADLRRPDSAASDATGRDAINRDSGPGADANVGSDLVGRDLLGVDAAHCTPPTFTACDGVPASGSSHTLVTSGTPGISGTHTLSIGDNRATVQNAMGVAVETPAVFNALAVIFCGEGLILYFADDLSASGTTAHEGELSATDRLYKITAFGNFNGATDTGTALALGDTATEATTALGSADFTGTGSSVAGAAGEYRFWYSGHSVLLVSGVVETMSVHAPQSPTGTIDDAISFSGGTVGAVSVSHNYVVNVPVATGSSLATIRSALGATPEADGDLTVTVGSVPLNVAVLSYSVLGLRFSGPATQVALSGDNRKIYTAVVTAPFQGKDSDVGIGSTKAEVEALLGAGVADAPDPEGRVLYRYTTGSRKTGVYYVLDESCVQRAITFVVNLVEAN